MNMWRVAQILLAVSWLTIGGCGASPPGVTPEVSEQHIKLPRSDKGFVFAVLGDTGTGGREQLEVANLLAAYHKLIPFKVALMLGDNLYGGESPKDYERKFELPYKPLLDAGVKFYASLGNHDDPAQRLYKGFNMNGERYYTFSPKNDVRFFALDSTYMSPEQVAWLEKELRSSGSGWKIAYCHHPLYSSGRRHGSDLKLREVLEPLFVKYGVDVALAGHEHFYERLNPQKGVAYFIEGGSAKLRRGNIRVGELTAKGFDTDRSFMLMEIVGDKLYFQTISRVNETVDFGVVTQRETKGDAKGAATWQ